MNKFETKIPPNMIEFRHTSLANEWVMRITADRRIEVNEDVEVNDAAKKVLEAMQHMLTPQRTWVGLTDKDIGAILEDPTIAEKHQGNWLVLPYSYARAVEAKLKEKNT